MFLNETVSVNSRLLPQLQENGGAQSRCRWGDAGVVWWLPDSAQRVYLLTVSPPMFAHVSALLPHLEPVRSLREVRLRTEELFLLGAGWRHVCALVVGFAAAPRFSCQTSPPRAGRPRFTGSSSCRRHFLSEAPAGSPSSCPVSAVWLTEMYRAATIVINRSVVWSIRCQNTVNSANQGFPKAKMMPLNILF